MTVCTFVMRSLEDTDRFAQELITLSPLPRVIALVGNLGSGKTTFTQSLGRALGIQESLASPTFTLLNHYDSPDKTFVHGDFYRLESPEAIVQLGITDAFTDPDTITVIEWADRHRELFPPHTLWLTWELHDNHRTVKLETESKQLWQQLEEKWL